MEKKEKKERGSSLILFLLLIAVAVIAFIYIMHTSKQIGSLQGELNDARSQLQDLQEQNEMLSGFLDPSNKDALMESKAIQENYGYPDQSVYENITPGNDSKN
ncbi:MAG: hypothetical protein IK104_08970 [Clostridia bacterium]|nr:hypothetical protein [Clostridia bacterium]